MSPALTLLDGVRWRGTPIAGVRAQTLLAVLVRHGRDGAGDNRLVTELWGDHPPANPAKALQVVVSRARAASAPEVVVRTPRGYQLGLPDDDVDVLRLCSLVAWARAALADGDATAARDHAQAALALANGAQPGSADSPLDDLLAFAARRAVEARALLGVALQRCGEHAAALPLLDAAVAGHPDDEDLLAALLRSEAAVRGPGAALGRYASYRHDLVERLGVEPGERLRRLHAELLALDQPVRDGLRFDTTSLLGRDHDLAALRALLRSGRVTSIVGTGGLGKTRLAHVLGREAEQPVVQFVELVGVTAGEDVVSEIGSVLGVRDSLSSRRALTPAQRADVRARIAQQLGQAPTLLILDNCEHVVEDVADLVAFLVGSTRDLHVLTTSRAPLAVAAERVYPLGELGAQDAADLFRQRAVAARPDVVLDDRAIADIVARLDGLPLAIELAAVKVRVMSVGDIARRLEDRFTLLRGGVRGAPDRHQTLLAVIEWSQNLLADRERRAWRWLSVFHDGCTLAAAEEMLGPGAVDAVQSLVDQSLLAVRESGAGVRFRMLETVREFGRRQLARSGEEAVALAAHRRWATRYADAASSGLYGLDQVRCMDLMHEEETNLADVLRQAITAPDPPTVVVLFAALGTFWSISDDHPRVFALADAIRSALRGWEPPPALADHTRTAVAGVLFENALMVDEEMSGLEELWDLVRRLGPGSRPEIAASVAVVLAIDPSDPDGITGRLDELCESPDPGTATAARMWCGHARENAGDPEGAIALTAQALAAVPEDAGPWGHAVLHTQLAQLHASLGRHDEAVEHAEPAIPVLDRLGAVDDAFQLRAITAVHALVRGRFDDAERIFRAITTSSTWRPGFGSEVTVFAGRAELALARGRTAEGLLLYRETVTRVRELRFPGLPDATGREPWTIFGESACVVAHALHGTGEDGADIEEALRRRAFAFVQPAPWRIDHPVMGVALYGLGLWALRRGTLPAPVAVRLVALADRFAYNRSVPTMDWAHAVDAAERAAPGLLAEILAGYGDRRGPELIDEARGVLRRAFG